MMLNHKACAIIKQRNNRVVFQEEQIKRGSNWVPKQKCDDPCAWRGERDTPKIILYKARCKLQLFNTGP
jgi:hypothetical protein